jgi:hypothetical protein
VAGSLDGRARRVRRLENGSAGPCEECGFDGDWSNVEIVVEWYDGEEEYTGPEDTTYCDLCGEPTETVVVWDDLLDHERRESRGWGPPYRRG